MLLGAARQWQHLQSSRRGQAGTRSRTHRHTAPAPHTPEKITVLQLKQEETGTKSIRDGKLREDSPSAFIVSSFSLLEKSREVIPLRKMF